MSPSVKRVLIFGNAWLLLYAGAAVYFFRERIFLDGAYYFFHVVQEEWFHVEHQRFILIISQLLAVAGTKLGLSLNAVLLLNSLNPVIYLWALFLLSIFLLKQEGTAWALLLGSVAGIQFIYFIPMYEVWYGGVGLIFFAGMLEKRLYQQPREQIIFGVSLLTLLFSYPLVLIGLLCFSFLHFIQYRPTARLLLIYAASLLIWLGAKYFFLSDYETGKVEYPLSQMGNTLRVNFATSENLWSLGKFLLSVYGAEIFLLCLTVGYWIRRRERGRAIILLTTLTGFLALLLFTHQQPWRHSNYFERMYLLLVPLGFVPFLTYVFPDMKRKVFFEILFLVILGWEARGIAQNAPRYREHSQLLDQQIGRARHFEGSKFMIDFAKHPELNSLDEWSLPMATLIFSSLKNSSHSITVSWKADIENPHISSKLSPASFRLRLDEIFDDTWPNPQYFYLKPGAYSELEW
jgi:hypothetical protein